MHGDAELERLADAGRLRRTARMPPQKVVSSRITSTAVSSTLAASCSKFTTTVLVASGMRTFSRVRRMPFRPKHRVFEIVVVQILDRLAEADRLLGGPHAVRIEAEASRPGTSAASAR